jgi:hypothetical protein
MRKLLPEGSMHSFAGKAALTAGANKNKDKRKMRRES